MTTQNVTRIDLCQNVVGITNFATNPDAVVLVDENGNELTLTVQQYVFLRRFLFAFDPKEERGWPFRD